MTLLVFTRRYFCVDSEPIVMLIAWFELDDEAIALDEGFRTGQEMINEAERVDAHNTNWPMLCLWVASSDLAAAEEAIRNEPTIAEIVATNDFADERYYFCRWAETDETRLNEYIDTEGSMLQASATSGGWEAEIRFVTRE